MQLTINLPNREEQLALNRQRWAEVLEDRTLTNHPYRIETNAFGQIVMTPPAAERHSDRQGEIVYQLRSRLGGRAKPECPVSTADGVKAIDVGWYSDERNKQVSGQIACEIAPEICVEILSPSNTANEILTKFQLYFDAGAIECWTCDLEGRMNYFLDGDTTVSHHQSRLCPEFPSQISQ